MSRFKNCFRESGQLKGRFKEEEMDRQTDSPPHFPSWHVLLSLQCFFPEGSFLISYLNVSSIKIRPFYILLNTNNAALHKALIVCSQHEPAPTTCSHGPSSIDLNYPPFGCTSSFNARSIPCN